MSQYHRSHKVEVQPEQEIDHINVQSANLHLDRIMMYIPHFKMAWHSNYNSKFIPETLRSIV